MPFHLIPARDRKLHGLLGKGREERVDRGTSIYAPGEAAERLYAVRSGYVRLSLPEAGSDRTRAVAVAGPGEVFGLEAVLPKGRRVFGASAGEEVTVASVPGVRTLRALRNTTWTLPLLVVETHRDLARARWAGPGAGGPSTVQRLADLLLDLADRLGETEGKGVRIPHWLTHRELADLVGGHRSTVTTRINEWIYGGVLDEVDHTLVVVDRGALESDGSGQKSWIDDVDPLASKG